jgi:hypothetical protein
MTLVGKIFTVLILVMSVAFLMLAVTVFATHRNWRDAAGKAQADLTARQAENNGLREEIQRIEDRLAVEQAARRFALAGLQSRLETAQQQLQQRERAYDDLLGAHGLAVETLNTNQVNVAALSREVEGLREEIRNVQRSRDEQLQAVVEVTDQLNQIEGQRQQLVERQDQLLDSLARMKSVLERHELTEFTPVHDIPPPVDGVVTAVGNTDLIEISIGSDDGLRKGHTLEVYRNNSYLGRIQVQHTEPDRAVGRILREFRKGVIRKGDRVATKLS